MTPRPTTSSAWWLLLTGLMLSACTGEGESPDVEGTPDDDPKPLNLTVEAPITGNFTGGVWTPATGAAWYVNAKGERLKTRFLANMNPDKRVVVKLWETEFDDPCSDAYGSLAANRWVTFTVPAKVGVTRDPDQGFPVLGGMVKVAYVKNRVEHVQIAENARVDLTEVEPATRGKLAAQSIRTVDAIALNGEFAVEFCIDEPLVTPAAN